MITNILFILGGGIVGFLVCAFLTAGKVVDLVVKLEEFRRDFRFIGGAYAATDAAHARAADALSTLHDQRAEIRSIISGNKTVRTSRIAEVIGE